MSYRPAGHQGLVKMGVVMGLQRVARESNPQSLCLHYNVPLTKESHMTKPKLKKKINKLNLLMEGVAKSC